IDSIYYQKKDKSLSALLPRFNADQIDMDPLIEPWYRKVVGADYSSAMMLTQLVTVLTARLSCAELLPFEPLQYVVDVRSHLAGIDRRCAAQGVAVPTAARAAVDERLLLLELSSRRMQERLQAALASGALDHQQRRAVNVQLLQLERCWLDRKGLPGRPWYRSLYAASDPTSGYAAWMLPALRLAVEAGGDVAAELGRVARALDRIYARLIQIEAILVVALDE
ncbi:MAG: transferrin receptor-like dimerization domain-containing protein, partial [Planctomycetota bacterium]